METKEIVVGVIGLAFLAAFVWGKFIVPNFIWVYGGTGREGFWDYVQPIPERRRRAFNKALGFWPQDLVTSDECSMMLTAQERVDNRLHELAQDVGEAFQIQEVARHGGDKRDLERADSTVAYYKVRFWGAWEAARNLGFVMKETYMDYAKAEEYPSRVSYPPAQSYRR